jgi:hypothetical protein
LSGSFALFLDSPPAIARIKTTPDGTQEHGMNNTRLIIITGISGAGKSTTAQNLARQYRLNGIRHVWLHEEIRRHPIRTGEFTSAPLETDADFAPNIRDYFRRWDRFMKRILRSKSIYVMEGMLTENIIRYFYPGNYPEEKILAFYDELFGRLAPVCPMPILLHRPNLQETLEAMFKQRGEWWKNLILHGRDWDRYKTAHGLEGDRGVYTMWERYQALSNVVVQRYPGPKLKIDTSGRDWDSYIEQITHALGLKYYPPEILAVRNPEQYLGRYTVEVDGQTHMIEVCYDGTRLYVKSWWPYMPLLTLGGSRFEFSSFPIKLFFRKDAHGRVETVDVSGIYDWEIVGTTMKKVPD